METASIVEIAIVIILSIALILFLVRRNVKDEQNTDPELTDAFEDAKDKEDRKL